MRTRGDPHWMFKAAARSSRNVERREFEYRDFVIEVNMMRKRLEALEALEELAQYVARDEVGMAVVVRNGWVEDAWIDKNLPPKQCVIIDPDKIMGQIQAGIQEGFSGFPGFFS